MSTFVDWGEGYGSFLSGRVVDMFYFPLFDWPDWVPFVGGGTFFGAVFNFADICVCVGVALWVLVIFLEELHEDTKKGPKEQ